MNLGDKDIEKIDTFLHTLEQDISTLKHFTKFLILDEKKEKVIKEGLKVLKYKLKSAKNAESIDELKDVLRLKNIIKESRI